MAYTVSQIINIAKISQFLCLLDIEKKGLYGGGQDLSLPRKIYCVRKNVEWLFSLSSSDSSLVSTSNYLYALCAPYNQQALFLLNISGGQVSPVSPVNAPEPYDFEVTSSSFIVDGQSVKSIPLFRGYNLLLIRGGIPQSQTNIGGNYFIWNKNTAQLEMFGAAQLGEIIQLYPY
jgi:hypothetical protein